MRLARLDVAGDAVWSEVADGTAYRLAGHPFAGPPVRGAALGPVAAHRLLRPVEPGGTVYCLLGAWRNRDDRDGPAFFVKPNATLIDPGDPIVHPATCRRVVYEAELAIVIGRECRAVTPAQARAHVLGWTCANDVTATEMAVRTNAPFLPGKSFSTFGVIGPWIETAIDPDDVALRARVDGELRTDRRTKDMLWTSDEIVSWISGFLALRPGDVICCGTPPEFGEIRPGEEIAVEIEGIGTLASPVVAEASAPAATA